MRGSGASRLSVAPGGALAGPWVRNPLWRNARAVPSLDLQFADNKSLVDGVTGQNLVTFTRASNGTYVGSNGLIKSATTNEPRFDHNPTTGESLGLLVEEARTNLSLQSEDFSNAYWVKTSCTITSNESTAPDGTLTADLWTNTGSPGVIENSITKDTTARTYTTSLWVKGTLTQLTVSLDDGTTVNRGRVQYNLSTNVVGTVFNDGLFTNTSGTLTRFPDGWVRVTMTTTTSIGTTIRLRPFFSGTGSTARIWGAQVEEGAFATSYIPTTTATVTRAADVASITGSNFSSWYRQDEGALYAAYSRQVTGTATFAASLTETLSASSANRIQFSLNTNNVPSYALVAAGTTQGTLTPGGTAPNYVTAYGYKLDDVACSSSGSTVATDTTAVMPTGIAYLNIGSNPANASGFLNGTIKRLTYWPVRLANTTLQAISQP